MTDKIVVLSTCASEQEGEKLARMLLEARVAACVNVVPRVRSFYHWKGALETADECLLVIKSTRGLFAALRAVLEQGHSYEVPEVVALQIVEGSENYINWLDSNLRKAGTE
jgi:periplasmic divalent cation tolerance protein